MTFLVERLAELRRQLDHLYAVRERIREPRDLESDLSLHNDALFALLVVCQSVIDIAGELAGRRGLRFNDYTEAVRALGSVEGISRSTADALLPLPGFRNVLIHEYVALDYARVIAALHNLDAVEQLIAAVSRLETR
ncbi:MAG: hypothetical protein A2085_00360 [Gemmatimonadetes bacterium GWC2_71_10]|nr:MAG: hypothetical protein A2085_00360 [Gemmatimonadetes bacterium GWC2_71_10]